MIRGRPYVQRVRFAEGYQPRQIIIPELSIPNALSIGSDFAALHNASFDVMSQPNRYIPATAEWNTLTPKELI